MGQNEMRSVARGAALSCALVALSCSDSGSGLTDAGGGNDLSANGQDGMTPAPDSGPDGDVGPGDDGGGAVESSWTSIEALPNDRTCGVTNVGRVVCWGREVPPELPLGPAPADSEAFGVPMEFVDGTAGRLCGRSMDGLVYCWGAEELDRVPDIAGEEGGRPVVRSAACFLRPDGSARCASLPASSMDGGRSVNEANVPANVRFSIITLGQDFGCGIGSEDNRLQCWGDDLFDIVGFEPTGEFKTVSGGTTHACTVSTSNDLVCWGSADVAAAPERPRDLVSDVAVGGTGTCARLASSSEWVCWNRNLFMSERALGEETPADSNVEDVSVSSRHACGRRGDEWICWGYNEFGQLDIPEL